MKNRKEGRGYAQFNSYKTKNGKEEKNQMGIQNLFPQKTQKRTVNNAAEVSSGVTEAASGEDDKKVMEETIEYLLNLPSLKNDLMTVNNGTERSEAAKAKVLLSAKQALTARKLSEKQINQVMKKLPDLLWGYYKLESLIADERISDIRIMAYNVIGINVDGKWEISSIKFDSKEEYNTFMQSIAVMNQINLADVNALSLVTDKNSNPDWRLRIAVATGYVNSADTYFTHIRKHPKTKRSLDTLEKMGMMPKHVREYLQSRYKKGLYITGQTGSGKTHLLNALIDLIDRDKQPGICMQESEELFSSDINSLLLFLHVVLKKGEGKIKYDLEDESKFGLLTSNKYFIVGEIKGSEAAYFSNACYNGSIGWATGHGETCEDGLDKLCDYIMRYTGYDLYFTRKIIKSLETVVFMKDYKVMEIKEAQGFDTEKGAVIYKTIYKRGQEV